MKNKKIINYSRDEVNLVYFLLFYLDNLDVDNYMDGVTVE